MIKIRRIRIGEFDLYRKVRLRALKEDSYAFCATYESALERTEEKWRDQADKAAEGSDQAIFIAFCGGDPVGLSAVYKDKRKEDEAEVFQVWVSAESRGTGLGKRIMDSVLEWSKSSGYKRIIATVANTNKKAIGFYENYGFEKKLEDSEETKMAMEIGSKKSAHATRARARV
ncbi:GNAT family N-acetyltransferase [Puniceicoccus vermicola]|uniref:GNAT family N-acetyltransferase n=1 Tax=Puniceicoccus vermicola TaxID=388746 RepID=A0A7X1AVK8_9BACT|nr:GNAT family N-acetyltransferase [Puniceicoccus vermicola]MBC2600564.1 GNAT family N-acetyltransferase [Puniceicoccus vermicola]